MSVYMRREFAKLASLKPIINHGKTNGLKVIKFLRSGNKEVTQSGRTEALEDILTANIKYRLVTKKTRLQDPQFYISVSDVKETIPGLNQTLFSDNQAISQELHPLPIDYADETNGRINFFIKPCYLCNIILKKVLSEGDTYGYHGIIKDKQTILVEYSSPNIAKPFHAGHLRSAIIGNFISNLYEAVGHKVIRINYLGDWGTQYGKCITRSTHTSDWGTQYGKCITQSTHTSDWGTQYGKCITQSTHTSDWGTQYGKCITQSTHTSDWGTQYGLLAQGFNKYGNKEDLNKDPMKHLYMVYVKINEDVAKEQQNSGPDKHEKGETHRKSLEIFRNMEQGTASEDLQLWKHFRDISIEKYREVYERLNIKFTDYEGESMYSKKSLELIEELKQRDLLHIDDTTGKGYIDIEDEKDNIKAVVQKSDGSTLYLTRDIAAVLDRHKRYNFDRTHYVVEDGQDLHFKMLKGILQKLNVPWIQRYGDQIHIRFGRISNLSTRKGKAVFLDDILNEAKRKDNKTIHSKQTSKEVDSTETVADILGVSSIIVQDLKEKRLNTYKFSWDKVLSFKGDSGIVLQYAHARLCSLIDQCGCDIHSTDFDTKYLTEPEAIQLILHIASYEDTVDKCLTSLEACHLVHYLFSLSKFISVAHRNLKVKDQPKEIAQARLQVFKCAKTTLANGMTLLGITPLDKM
ncbi:RARS [Mytilus edulis]|uniref:Probable arginine--tRNA ligase, mitochondrial n=1 Tax=Mytilus edulis TaxID=6550 RepID=A0A8S3UL20_MYTED|nr:RARS [Mytilus edulis]